MQSTYRLKANELDEQFIAGLKAIYKDKDIEIIVYEVEGSMSEVACDISAVCDETEYLLKSEANKQRLMEAKKNVENKTNLVEIDLADLE
jgi:antitoxin YefM